uniref:Uncharacterized protein n=1 Tax=Chromera velia CCMP2878 TaxID=1169474 RepID=A0A0G4I5W4_9ALVE|eukprot:Cvel_57.t1-p1 / transcript=Cvel_57.t1 / gene=Cvel_57 / organism=Chromera_velia_CCMP2878 / gene_product=hypothetical protein / transcript_product=hypothetical protein / location=Cvel_scaffold6:39102-44318(+) / protein_length=407 / sequence_SO=supercontig / SO=protein_coding / is_pseudo=false
MDRGNRRRDGSRSRSPGLSRSPPGGPYTGGGRQLGNWTSNQTPGGGRRESMPPLMRTPDLPPAQHVYGRGGEPHLYFKGLPPDLQGGVLQPYGHGGWLPHGFYGTPTRPQSFHMATMNNSPFMRPPTAHPYRYGPPPPPFPTRTRPTARAPPRPPRRPDSLRLQMHPGDPSVAFSVRPGLRGTPSEPQDRPRPPVPTKQLPPLRATPGPLSPPSDEDIRGVKRAHPCPDAPKKIAKAKPPVPPAAKAVPTPAGQGGGREDQPADKRALDHMVVFCYGPNGPLHVGGGEAEGHSNDSHSGVSREAQEQNGGPPANFQYRPRNLEELCDTVGAPFSQVSAIDRMFKRGMANAKARAESGVPRPPIHLPRKDRDTPRKAPHLQEPVGFSQEQSTRIDSSGLHARDGQRHS